MNRISRGYEKDLANAADYKTWHQVATELDHRDGFDEWKANETSDDFDWRLIRSRLRQIRQYRAENDVPKLVHHMRQGLHWNLGNTGNPELYAWARTGTKHLVREYITEVSETLNDLCENEDARFPHHLKLKFFQEVAQSYGRSALMLSGGATLGLFHVGVVRSLYREGLLPNVLSGSSAGSIVASVVGTRAPEEAATLLDPESAYYHFWRMLPLRKMFERGAIMDQKQLRHAIAMNTRDMTFEEAYKLSGKIVNITVSPAGLNQPPKLLNYLTFPYLYMQEAVLASCAVPVIFPPVMLMTQDEKGQRVPYMPLLRWNDGSLKSDLPTLRLRRLHNVNHFIVSQTNPHVLPFMSKNEPGAKGPMAALRSVGTAALLGTAKSVVDLARGVSYGMFRKPLDLASSVLDQDYRGNINIMPEVSLWRYSNVTSNPTLESIKRFMHEGEKASWPRIEMIRNQTMISQTLDKCVSRLEHTTGNPNVCELPRKPPALRVVRHHTG